MDREKIELLEGGPQRVSDKGRYYLELMHQMASVQGQGATRCKKSPVLISVWSLPRG